MSQCTFRDGRVVEDYGNPYIVAEVNSSHNGKMDVAKQMIEAAARIGCDCVKFQSWSAASLYSTTYYRENPMAKRFVARFSLAPAQLKELAAFARAQGIEFSSTPYSEEEVDFLVEECQAPFLKVASMELNHPDFLRYIGGKRGPVVLSTGMGTWEEVRSAVETLRGAGAPGIVLLHCVSQYPTELKNIALRNIEGLREAFPACPVGFSDHTIGDTAAVAATAMGAALLEKHLTLDHTKVGMDNAMATEPEAFRLLVSKCRSLQEGMGTKERVLTEEDFAQRKMMRRSIIVTRDLQAGACLQREDLAAKRPGTGFPPTEMEHMVGRRLKRAVSADTVLVPEDLEGE